MNNGIKKINKKMEEKSFDFKNPIWVAGQIDNKDFFVNFTRRFSELMAETKEGDKITVFINSPGGESHTALGIFDLLKLCSRNLVGVVSGIAFSGASLILQACQKRIMTQNSNIISHLRGVIASHLRFFNYSRAEQLGLGPFSPYKRSLKTSFKSGAFKLCL